MQIKSAFITEMKRLNLKVLLPYDEVGVFVSHVLYNLSINIRLLLDSPLGAK